MRRRRQEQPGVNWESNVRLEFGVGLVTAAFFACRWRGE